MNVPVEGNCYTTCKALIGKLQAAGSGSPPVEAVGEHRAGGFVIYWKWECAGKKSHFPCTQFTHCGCLPTQINIQIFATCKQFPTNTFMFCLNRETGFVLCGLPAFNTTLNYSVILSIRSHCFSR